MIIHAPEKINQNEHTILWAKVELEKEAQRFPKYLWYRVPNKYAPFLSTRSDAFLLPCLPAAMSLGEDITVRGAVSPRLAYHLDEYQFILNFRFPEEVRPVAIQYERLSPLDIAGQPPPAVGATFSGGVDSLFALYKHLPANQPNKEYQITHLLFIHGFDIMLRQTGRYRALYTRFYAALASIGVELVPLETNIINMITPRLRFPRYYAPSLLGSALSLDGLFKRFIISNSWDYYQLEKIYNSSNPLSDRLASTETLDFEHFGANYRRVEKVRAISDWKFAQDNLRVCAQADLADRLLNCSRCGKCLRTMIPIYALGKMAQFHTFEQLIKFDRDILRWARKFDPYPYFTPENFIFLRKYNPALLPWLRVTIILGNLRKWLLTLVPGFIKKRLQRYGHFGAPFKEKDVFENFEVLSAIYSQD